MTGVLDAHLKKSGGEWLVGEKCTYADLAFVPWYWLCPAIMGEGFEKVSLISEWESFNGLLSINGSANYFFLCRNGRPSIL